MRKILLALFLTVAILAASPFVLLAAYGVLPAHSTLMISRWWNGQPVDRRWARLEEIAPDLARAVIVSEDARFCFHWGVDLRELKIVLEDIRDGGSARGASTITMQTVKNLVLWPDRSYLRKAVELPLALWLDLVLSKDRILETYLNIVQWGPGVFGAEAAAQHHFNKPARDLTRSEAMRLAAALPSPGTRNPNRPSRQHAAHVARIDRELKRSPWVFPCLPPAIDPQRSAAAAISDGGSDGGDGGGSDGGDSDGGGSDGGGLRPGLQPRVAGTARGDRLFSKPPEPFISGAIENI